MNKKFFVLLFFAAALTLAADSPVGKVWRYDFENINQRVVPAVSGGINGKIFAAKPELCRVVPGISGNGLEISGAKKSDRAVGGMEIKSLPVKWHKGFTMLVWVKFSPLLAGPELFKDNKVIIGNSGVRGPGWLFYITWGKLYLRTGDGKKTSSVSLAFSGFDRWRLLGIVYDGSKAAIYIDGEKVAEDKILITESNRNLFVGSSNGSNSQLYGTIDNLLIADRPFSAQEIAEIYLKERN